MSDITRQTPAPAWPAHTWLDPRVELRASRIGGRGLFAAAPIEAGEELIVWGGPSYTDAVGAASALRAGRQIMQWDDDIYSCDDGSDDDAYCINHSCDPNVWMRGAFRLVARRAIAAGEELTADYALWEADERYVAAWECRCDAPACRNRVTGRDWRQPELQARYRGHFSPLLTKRIARASAAGDAQASPDA